MKICKIKDEVYIHDDEYYYIIIRNNIRKYRLEKNLTQQELADMTGISREYICDVENESRNKHISIAYLGRIADALDIDISLLFERNKKEEEPN